MATVGICPTFGVGYQAFNVNGLPLNLGKLYTYLAGTTTSSATYTTSAGSTTNATPIILGADGRPPNEIWLDVTLSYRVDLKDSADNLIRSEEHTSELQSLTNLVC